MTKSILLDGTSRRLFEQQAPAALNLDMTRNTEGDYADPMTHGMYLGFLVGHVTGLSTVCVWPKASSNRRTPRLPTGR